MLDINKKTLYELLMINLKLQVPYNESDHHILSLTYLDKVPQEIFLFLIINNKFSMKSRINLKAVFLVVCDLSMNEL